VDSYTERGTLSSLNHVGRDWFDFVELEVGLSFWGAKDFGCWRLAPQLSAAYIKDFLAGTYHVNANVIGAASQKVLISNVSDHQWKINAGLSAHYLRCTEMFFVYEALFDDAYDNTQNYRIGIQTGF
jgi:hypothetical protein